MIWLALGYAAGICTGPVIAVVWILGDVVKDLRSSGDDEDEGFAT